MTRFVRPLTLLLCMSASCAIIADVHDRVLETTSSAGGAGGVGGGGGEGGGPSCEPEACYDGDADTRGVGLCTDGIASCVDGVLGACEGQVLPALESCDPSADHDCDGTPECEGDHEWSLRFGDGAKQVGRDLALDSQGNIVIAGIFEGQVDFGGHIVTSDGLHDIFVVKITPDAQVLWARRFGDAQNQFSDPTRVVVDGADNIFVAGAYGGEITVGSDTLTSDAVDGYLFKLDGDGNDQWARKLGGPATQRVRGVAVDPVSGHVVVTGWSGDDVSIGGVNHVNPGSFWQMFVARFATDGTRDWSFAHAGADDVFAGDVAVRANGDVVVTGYIAGDTSLGGTTLIAAGDRSMFVARYDASGVYQDDAAFGAVGASNGLRLALRPTGETLVVVRLQNAGGIDLGVGTFTSTVKGVAIAELDADLDGVRGRLFDGIEQRGGIGVDGDGYVALTLQHDASVDYGLGAVPTPANLDAAVLKLMPDLTTIWVHTAAASDEAAAELVVDDVGRVMAVGHFTESIDLGGGELDSAGETDVFVVRYGP